MFNYIVSVMMMFTISAAQNASRSPTGLQKTEKSKNLQYKIKNYKVGNIEYQRVPTKWTKETLTD
jgi:hypothetical protein